MPKTALIILDGIGISPNKEGNALLNAKIDFIKNIISSYPKALLKTSSQEVGLPWGEVGNSEVGHTTIGLGRVVLQDLPQIDKAIKNGSISDKNSIKYALEKAKTNKKVHLIGIASDGAVHGHISHLTSIIELFKNNGVNPILHLICDGRDAPEKSFERYFKTISETGAQIGSVSGRYYAMDRDKNWDRIEKAYQAICGKLKTDIDILDYINEQYQENITDEFIKPISFIDESELDLDNDPIIFCNYRADRAVEITRAFVDKNFNEFSRPKRSPHFITMTTYEDNLPCKVIFSNVDLNDQEQNPLTNSISEVISQNNLKQFHIAETEKYAHVTYFFSGGTKDEFKNQENKIIPSKKVKSYDNFPQMRAPEITLGIVQAIEDNFDFIVANYANGDMVGHSGNLEKTILSLEILNKNLEKAVGYLLENDYEVFITSDHGNADEMIDLKSLKPSKEHSLNPAFLIYLSNKNKGNYMDFETFLNEQPIGILSDIAPTVLEAMNIPQSNEMTGVSLMNSLK